jgi:hypothetical protein
LVRSIGQPAGPSPKLSHLHIISADVLQSPDQLQLWKEEALLEDAKKLAELKIENDDVVAMCYQTAGAQTCSPCTGRHPEMGANSGIRGFRSGAAAGC